MSERKDASEAVPDPREAVSAGQDKSEGAQNVLRGEKRRPGPTNPVEAIDPQRARAGKCERDATNAAKTVQQQTRENSLLVPS